MPNSVSASTSSEPPAGLPASSSAASSGSKSGGPRLGSWTSPQILLLIVLALLYGVALFSSDFLLGPLVKDEKQLWRSTLFFVDRWPPGLSALRSYPEPMTPLSLVLWAGLEKATGHGLLLGRLLNTLLSICMILAVGLWAKKEPTRAVLAAAGLILFPYLIPLSVLLYTDVIAACLVLCGFVLRRRGRFALCSLCFILAIATRQYMVAFPTALAANELLRQSAPWEERIRRSLPYLVAGASLLCWILFLGGLAPKTGLEHWPRHIAQLGARFVPFQGLYFLACVGAYFVVPEWLFFRRWRGGDPWSLVTPGNAVIALSLLILFVLFPPALSDHYGGIFNRAAQLLPSELLRLCLFYGLALASLLRFSPSRLGFWLIFVHLPLMANAWFAWDKYNLPLMVVLWYLVSEDDEDVGDGEPPVAVGPTVAGASSSPVAASAIR